MKCRHPNLAQLFFIAGLSLTAASTSKAASLLVSNINGQIEQFSSSGVDLGAFATTGLNGPRGIAIDSVGNVYVANSGDSTIEKFTAAGTGTNFVNTGLNSVAGLAYDNVGDLYATNYGNNTISKFDASGNLLATLASPTLDNPYGIAINKQGDVFVSNFSNSSISEFSSSGTDLGVFATTGLLHPIGVTFDVAGNLYVANQSLNTIEKFTPTGAASLFANTGLSQPVGLTADDKGNIFAANLGAATIEKYNSFGADLGVIATDSAGTPTFLSFDIASVPEPRATSLLIPLVALGAVFSRWFMRQSTTRNESKSDALTTPQ